MFLIRYVSSRHGRTSNFLLTAIVTIINDWMLLSCIVGIRPSSVVIVVPVLSVIVDPLKTRHRPLHHLTPWELVSKQVKGLLGGEDYRVVFVSITPTTQVDFCIRVVHTIWKCPIFTILVLEDIVVPVNKAIIQIFGTVSLFIYAVLTCC